MAKKKKKGIPRDRDHDRDEKALITKVAPGNPGRKETAAAVEHRGVQINEITAVVEPETTAAWVERALKQNAFFCNQVDKLLQAFEEALANQAEETTTEHRRVQEVCVHEVTVCCLCEGKEEGIS